MQDSSRPVQRRSALHRSRCSQVLRRLYPQRPCALKVTRTTYRSTRCSSPPIGSSRPPAQRRLPACFLSVARSILQISQRQVTRSFTPLPTMLTKQGGRGTAGGTLFSFGAKPLHDDP